MYAKNAALRLDQYRVSLQTDLDALAADLAKSRGMGQPELLALRTESLRLGLSQSLDESLELSRAIVRYQTKLNLVSMVEATVAQRRLIIVCNEAIKALKKLDSSAAGKS